MIRSRRSSRWLPSVAAGLFAGLMLLAALDHWRAGLEPVVPADAPASGGSALPPAPAMTFASLDPAREASVLGRPPFSPTRRPPAPKPANGSSQPAPASRSSEPAAPPLNYTLVGIVRDGTGGMAVLQSADGQPARTLRAGQSLEGWMLTRIETDRVSMRNGNFQRELVLDFRHATPRKP